MSTKFSIFKDKVASSAYFQFSIESQSGQVIVILLLLMLVALSVGLALTQKSVTDVTTSTQSEQSQRAFSAAEAGIEKALSGTLGTGQELVLDNSSKAKVDSTGQLPSALSGDPIEYPPVGRETTAQFKLTGYTGSSLDLYFGNADTTSDKPAVEVKIVMKSNNAYYSKTYYYDSSSTRSGPTGNNFAFVAGCGSVPSISTILGLNREFYCKQTIGPIPDLGNNPPVRDCPNAAPNNCQLILARVRFLYANENHNLALAPLGGANLPPQVQIYNATGTSGQSEKQIQAFKVIDVVPPWFDFAVFSVDEIRK